MRRPGQSARGRASWVGISCCSVRSSSRSTHRLYAGKCFSSGLVFLFGSHTTMLLPDRVTFMQRIQAAPGLGYSRWFIGRIDSEKWPRLAAKFAQRYGTDLDKGSRYRRRRAGEVVALVYGFQMPSEKEIVYCLLASEGKGLLNDLEKDMKQFNQDRVKIDGYELVHDGKTWSWRMTQRIFSLWQNEIHRAAALPPTKRKKGHDALGPYDHHAEKIMDLLYSTPGFRLVRRQVGKLAHYMREEFKRLRPAGWPAPRPRTFLKYVQRLPNEKAATV